MAGQQLPEGRYGSRSRRRPSRRLRWVLFAVALVLSTGASIVGYRNLGSAPIEANRLTYEALDSNSMQITLEVRRDSPDRPVVCVVQAKSLDGTETGRKEILVPPSDGTAHPVTVVTTSAPPVSGNVYGCSYNVPEYLSTPTRPSG